MKTSDDCDVIGVKTFNLGNH